MNSQKKKKVARNLVLLVVLLVLFYFVFRDDYQDILESIRKVSVPALLMLLGMGMVYQMLDAAAAYTLIHARCPSLTYRQAFEITFLGVFGNVATFSAGIIPMQSFYLYRRGMQVGSGIGTLILRYIFHKAVIFLYAAFMILTHVNWLAQTAPELAPYIYLGTGVCAVIILVLVLLCTWQKIQRLLLLIIDRLPDTGKWESHKAAWRKNLEVLYGESKEALKDPARCGKVMAWNVLKLFWLYLIPFLSMRVLHITDLSLGKVQVLASVMFLIVGVLPNVAGMGPAEAAFLILFSGYIGRVQASSAMILYRIATYFFPFLVSVVVFLKIKGDVEKPGKGSEQCSES